MTKPRLAVVSVILISLISLVSLIFLGGVFYWLALSPGKRPFLIVQICLRDEQNFDLFLGEMKSIAQSGRMNFIDGSAGTERDLVALKKNPNYRIVNIDVSRHDGMGVGAGNLGLSAYEVALGFSEGSNATEAHRFADSVVNALKQKWRVEIVPTGKGAFPMKNCSE